MKLCAALLPLLLLGASPVRSAAGIETLLNTIAAWQFDQSRQPLYDFIEFLQGKLDSPDEVRRLEGLIVQRLQSGATLAGKDFFCRQLRVIGGDASVPALAAMLLAPETSDMARYALEGIPGAAPLEALRAALPKSAGRIRIGIVNSLGQRRDAAAVEALRSLIAAPEDGVSEAAMAALAAIGNRQSLAALAAARGRPGGPEAWLRCAEQVAAGGDKAGALEAFRSLSAPGQAEMIRVAALGGLAAAAGKDSVQDLEKLLASSSPKLQAAAIRLLNSMPGPEITRLLASRVEGLPAEARIHALAALGERGDPVARPAVTQAAGGADPGVRSAALAALARIGDGSSVAVLAAAAARAEGAEQSAARESLVRLLGKDVEAAIVAGIATAAGGARLELIRAAGERGLSAAGGALIAAALEPDRLVRREALRALRTSAAPAQAPALLGLVKQTRDETERREAARALAAALKRTEPPDLGAVISACQETEDAQTRASLLEVLGQVSADEALPVLRSGLADSRPEIGRAAILALSEWLTPAPLPDLLGVAQNSANPAHRILALRGYIKLITAPSGRSMSETVGLLAGAMRLASQPDEKRAILSLLHAYPTEEALKIAESAASDSAVEREAKAAAGRVRLSLGAQR